MVGRSPSTGKRDDGQEPSPLAIGYRLLACVLPRLACQLAVGRGRRRVALMGGRSGGVVVLLGFFLGLVAGFLLAE
jgi:hypothetical protein